MWEWIWGNGWSWSIGWHYEPGHELEIYLGPGWLRKTID